MLLSDFSIRRPVSMVVIIIALMCMGLLALNKLRVNQIPDVEQPVMVVVIPRDQAAAIVRYMTEDPGGGKDLSAAARFALKQVGEFMTRAFSQAVNQFILDRARQAMPELSVLDSPQDAEDLFKDDGNGGPSLLIHCGLSDMDRTFEGKLAYVLDPAAQKDVIARLGSLLSGASK